MADCGSDHVGFRVREQLNKSFTSWASSFAPFRCSGLERLREKLFSPFPLICVTGANNQIFFLRSVGLFILQYVVFGAIVTLGTFY